MPTSISEIGNKVRAIAFDAMEKSGTLTLEQHIKAHHGGVMPETPCKWMIDHGMGGATGATVSAGATGATGGGAELSQGATGATGVTGVSGMSGVSGASVQEAAKTVEGGVTGATGASGQAVKEDKTEPKFKGIKEGKIYKDGVELAPTFQDGGTKSKWRTARNKWVKELLDVGDGTFDIETGKPVSFDSGFQMAFQTTDSEDGGMDDEEYDRLVDELSKVTGSKPSLGNFEVPEISFWVKDRLTAIKLMQEYNQHSIWNWKKSRAIMNKKLDKSTNSVKQGNEEK